ncbi:MAG: hypothetical protein HZA35_00550 [Parcubacteria group bacterium]|nr:hypothetical protein [Parcubacteria group bacterium]
MPDDQKPFHLSLDTPSTLPGEASPTPQSIVQNTTPPLNSTSSQPSPLGATAGTAPQATTAMPAASTATANPSQVNTASPQVTPTPTGVPAQTPTPSIQPVVPISEPTKTENSAPISAPITLPVTQPIHPPVMPAQGGVPRTPRTPALPMAPHIVVHTMESDIQDAKKTPQKHVAETPTQMRQPLTPPTQPAISTVPTTKGSTPKLLIGIVLVLVILGAVVYFGYDTIAPLFISKATLPIPQPTPPREEKVVIQPTSTAVIQPPMTHTSFLAKPANKVFSGDIGSLAIENIKALATPLTKEEQGTLDEVVPNVNTKNIPLKDFSALFLTSFPFDLFLDDFTLLTYHDTKGVWPVVIFKLRPNAENQNLILTKANIKRTIEQDSQTSITQLFTADPGAPTSNFIDGKVPNSPAEIRYRTFENGVALDYGWLGDKLIIATSYQALKETIVRLQ